MSQRASFVTEYVYCVACFQALWAVLKSDDKYLRTTVVPAWSGYEGLTNADGAPCCLPIIAGKIGGLYNGEEVSILAVEMRPEIERAICHPVRMAVLPDSDEPARSLVFHPASERP